MEDLILGRGFEPMSHQSGELPESRSLFYESKSMQWQIDCLRRVVQKSSGCMEKRFLSRSSGSVELIVLGLLAALVVALAFPMLTRLEQKPTPPDRQADAQGIRDQLAVD